MKTKIVKLKALYETIADEYVYLFEKKHGLELEHWVSDDKTGVACFGDIYFFNVSDIMYDINNKLPKGFILQWIEDNVDNQEKKGYINLNSYFKGMRFEDLPDVEK